MAEPTYRLEKVRIGDSYFNLRVSVDAEGIRVDYGGKDVSLAAALGTIHSEITNLQTSVENVENQLKTI